MSAKVPKLHKIHINRTRGVVEYKKGLRSFDDSQSIAREMLDMYIKVRYNGALNVWDEIQNLKQRFYALDKDYHKGCKYKYRELRWEEGWDYLFTNGSNHITVRRVVRKKKD